MLAMPDHSRPMPDDAFPADSLVGVQHAERPEVEAFIARVYQQRYGATVRSFAPGLLAFRDRTGALHAAVGLRGGADGPLFVEQYLDAPAELAIARRVGSPVRRSDVVEVGNFASRSAGDARDLIVHLTTCLHRSGVRWVVFSATRQLRNTFDRLRLNTVTLVDAHGERLQDASDWGRYYETQPQVLFGDVAAGYAFLNGPGDSAAKDAAASGTWPCLAVAS